MIISTNELRFEFQKVLNSLRRGVPLTLTYRNKPLARIVPIDEPIEISEKDPFYRITEIAVDAGSLTNREIDDLIYSGK